MIGIIHATGQQFKRLSKPINTRASVRQNLKNKQKNNKIGKVWQQYNHAADTRLTGLTGKFRQKGIFLIHLAKQKRWPCDRLATRIRILHVQQSASKPVSSKPGLFDTIRARMARSRELTV